MTHKLHNYLRAYRKRAGLTQNEMAELLGCQWGEKISRYERQSREPNLKTVFACQAIFGIPAHELFPGIYKQVEEVTKKRAQKLSEKLKDVQSNPKDAYKVNVLSTLCSSEAFEFEK